MERVPFAFFLNKLLRTVHKNLNFKIAANPFIIFLKLYNGFVDSKKCRLLHSKYNSTEICICFAMMVDDPFLFFLIQNYSLDNRVACVSVVAAFRFRKYRTNNIVAHAKARIHKTIGACSCAIEAMGCSSRI